MPLLSFYLILGPAKRIWLSTLESRPADWPELKAALQEVMRKVHIEFKQNEATLTLEHHLLGKYFLWRGRKVHYKRDYEAIFKAEYNPVTEEVTVKQASFSMNIAHLRPDFYEMERDKHYYTPPLIPKQHQHILGNPKLLFLDPAATRYPDYSGKTRQTYMCRDEKEPRSLYQTLHFETYAPRTRSRTSETD